MAIAAPHMSAFEGKQTSVRLSAMSANDPKRTSVIPICRDAPCAVSMVG